ncbi:helix-turn-helix domain-containing protein [Streptomyces sp. NRRL F-5065]|uniref:helix-turn-helix domain-containing protein n=1 Tax=Streptomyces sp. NRRL F-5065 TaxID=1463855 RepID=UPI000AD50054|nr:helix-turn-helix transcriptional regulator [Streptomyces sp. NRRL F-5065]
MSDTCEFCSSPLRSNSGKGRPRKYCGDSCRQSAYRRRLNSRPAAPSGKALPTQPEPAAEQLSPAPRSAPAARAGGHDPCAGDELLAEIARDIQDGARDLARLLPTLDGEEPLRRITQLHEQLDGLTAAAVGRARYRRVTWATVASILHVSEDTARHRYTDRYVLRRLARFNRSEMAPASLAGLFATPAGGAREAPTSSDTGGESGESTGDRGDGPDQQSAPVESSGAAYNRIAPILSMLIRTAQLTNKEISSRIGCSASYLSRILSGERVPTWELTRRFARACGADPEVLRAVWESEKLRYKTGAPAINPDTPAMTAAAQLRTAIRTLHLRAGRPAPSDIAVASRWLLTTGTVASLLEATVLPPRDVLHTFVQLLGGDTDHFSQLLDNAHHETDRDTAPLQPPAPAADLPSPTAAEDHVTPQPVPRPSCPTGPDAMMRAFSKILTENHTVEDGRARLLHKLAKKTPAQDSHHHRRRRTSLTEALRQRALPPTVITPLGGA